MRTIRPTLLRRASVLAAAAAVIGALSGCGASAPASATITQRAHPTPIISDIVPGAVGSRSSATSRHRSLPVATVNPSALAPPPQAKPLNPCTLVTDSQAAAFAGATLMTAHEAPQGPTCIFAFKGRSPITVTIGYLGFARTVHDMTHRSRVAIGGFRAECGTLGTQVLDVALSGFRVLSVTAPCAVAKRFAVRALAALHG